MVWRESPEVVRETMHSMKETINDYLGLQKLEVESHLSSFFN